MPLNDVLRKALAADRAVHRVVEDYFLGFRVASLTPWCMGFYHRLCEISSAEWALNQPGRVGLRSPISASPSFLCICFVPRALPSCPSGARLSWFLVSSLHPLVGRPGMKIGRRGRQFGGCAIRRPQPRRSPVLFRLCTAVWVAAVLVVLAAGFLALMVVCSRAFTSSYSSDKTYKYFSEKKNLNSHAGFIKNSFPDFSICMYVYCNTYWDSL